MFGLFSKIGEVFFQDEEDSISNDALGRHFTNAEEIKTFDGVITSLHTGYILVDNHVYCSSDSLRCFKRPYEVGDKVLVTATRKHDAAGWCAKNVQPFRDWDQWGDASEQKTEAGHLINADGDGSANELVVERVIKSVLEFSRQKQICILDDSTELDVSQISLEYEPSRGDWVKAEFTKGSDSGSFRAISLCPARSKEFDGTITSLQRNFGFINRDIYFAFRVLEDGYRPELGDIVCGLVVECQNGNCRWRATSVSPKKVSKAILGLTENAFPTMSLSLNDLLKNKNGIIVPDAIDFGAIFYGSVKSVTVMIRNSGTECQILKNCKFCGIGQNFKLVGTKPAAYFEVQEWKGELIIEAKQTRYLVIRFEGFNLGKEKKLAILDFGDFSIARYLTVEVKDPLQHDIGPTADYSRKKKQVTSQTLQLTPSANEWVIPGRREKPATSIRLPQRLPSYPVPERLRQAVVEKENLSSLVPVVYQGLSCSNYSRKFQVLLHIEEVQQEIEMKEFDMERVCFRPIGEFLALAVPGLAEGRPSVLVGDKIYATAPGQCVSGPVYEGCVNEVLKDDILLKFHQDFHSQYNGEDYDVSFQFNRTTLRRCHAAVEHVSKNASQVLFPTSLLPKIPQTKIKLNAKPEELIGKIVKVKMSHGIKRCPVAKLKKTTEAIPGHNRSFYKTNLNARQKAAVLRILDGVCRPLPYVLFGPPGTGKTITVVEAVLQIFTNLSWSRIIVCAPSNSAADLLAERLHESGHLKTCDMVRLNAFHRKIEDIPKCNQQYCSDGDDLQPVARYRIIVSTCSTIGILYGLGLHSGHFTHAFIDECGQATEPECMIAVGLVAPGGGQVVLAGDPMQLGPVLRNHDANELGLGKSFLERLMHMPLYTRNEKMFCNHGNYDPLLVTKLVKNYRSHEVLLQLPSKLFYYNELEVSADPDVVKCLSSWLELPNANNCPIVFHGVRGEDLREGNSPSWFNPVEALQVMHYLKSLVSYAGAKVTWDDIGVITPYRKQVEKIRLLIDSLGMEKVKVGSVEEFQGQERLAIIISTVRSNETFVSSDIHHNLGFLNNPKRFNVAVTRAQALLVVIGNPHVLSRDANWLAFIKHCVQLKAYIGCDLPFSCLQ